MASPSSHHDPHRHHALPLQAPAAEAEGGAARWPGGRDAEAEARASCHRGGKARAGPAIVRKATPCNDDRPDVVPQNKPAAIVRTAQPSRATPKMPEDNPKPAIVTTTSRKRHISDGPPLPMELPLSRKPVERDGDDYKRLKAAWHGGCAANDRAALAQLPRLREFAPLKSHFTMVAVGYDLDFPHRFFTAIAEIGCSEDLPYFHAWIPAPTMATREFEVAGRHRDLPELQSTRCARRPVVKTFPVNSLIDNERRPENPSNPRRRATAKSRSARSRIPARGVIARQRGLRACARCYTTRDSCHNGVYRNARITRRRRTRDVRRAPSRGPNGAFCAGPATPLVRAPGCVTASDIRCRFQVGVCRKRATMPGVRLVIGGGDAAIRWHQISTAMASGPQDTYAPLASPWTTSTASLISAGSTQSVITIGVSHRLLICHSVRFSPRT